MYSFLSISSLVLIAVTPPSCSQPVTNFHDRIGLYYIPSKAMLPTLAINDHILVDKRVYCSFPPKRGDIIVFQPTERLRQEKFTKVFVKRVIGLPGETVKVQNGQVYIDDQSLPEPYILAPSDYEYGPKKVPQNSYFVLGDNRNNSYDSHYWGFLPADLIVGKVTSIYLPRNHRRDFD